MQIDLSLDEVNQIISILGDQSFKTVYQLIGKIQNQAQAQLDNTLPTSSDAPPSEE